MVVILIGGEKGETGKTTLSTNLAIMANLMGDNVLLLDADKQASSAKSIAHRHDKGLTPTPTYVQIRGKYLHKEIEDLSTRYQLIIIDAGDQDSVELRSAISTPSVERLYTPLQPSEFDLGTLSIMDELIYTAKAFNQNLNAFVIFNQSPTHAKIKSIGEAKEFSRDYENVTICNTMISHRVSFQYAATHSMAVVEFEFERMRALPSWQTKGYVPKASIELCNLYKEIFNQKFNHKITDSLFKGSDRANLRKDTS